MPLALSLLELLPISCQLVVVRSQLSCQCLRWASALWESALPSISSSASGRQSCSALAWAAQRARAAVAARSGPTESRTAAAAAPPTRPSRHPRQGRRRDQRLLDRDRQLMGWQDHRLSLSLKTRSLRWIMPHRVCRSNRSRGRRDHPLRLCEPSRPGVSARG